MILRATLREALATLRVHRRWTALTTFGMLAALLGTGGWHWASWTALGVVAGVAIRYGVARAA